MHLNDEQKLAFAASCCERMLPNYLAFFESTRWGNIVTLRTALDRVWESVTKIPSELGWLDDLLSECEAALPDTENFAARLTSAALDAGVAIMESLSFLKDRETRHVVTVAALARDTVYMFLEQEKYRRVESSKLEEAIASDPLMVAEMLEQNRSLRCVASLDTSHQELVEQFRKNALEAGSKFHL
jgi:hypothetical protein